MTQPGIFLKFLPSLRASIQNTEQQTERKNNYLEWSIALGMNVRNTCFCLGPDFSDFSFSPGFLSTRGKKLKIAPLRQRKERGKPLQTDRKGQQLLSWRRKKKYNCEKEHKTTTQQLREPSSPPPLYPAKTLLKKGKRIHCDKLGNNFFFLFIPLLSGEEIEGTRNKQLSLGFPFKEEERREKMKQKKRKRFLSWQIDFRWTSIYFPLWGT